MGYGGTKSEMERLLEDAEKIKAANGEMVTYSIDSFADMVEAIHVVQTEMDISGISIQEYTELVKSGVMSEEEAFELLGTTAKEAVGTIEGSVNTMKAAWENLSTGMADETADMEQLTQDFVDSVGTAAKNILPRVQQIVTGVGTATVETISYLRETNETIDLVVSVVEDLGIVAATTGAVLAANFAGQAVKNIATVFIANAQALSYFTVESGKAAIAEATLNGTFSVGEIAVGVLTGKISLATAAQYAWNTAMNANPIGIVIAAVSALGIAAKAAYSGYKESVVELAETDGTLEGLVEKYEELSAQYAEYERKREEIGSASSYGYEMKKTKAAMEEVQTQIEALTSAEEAAAVAAGEITSESIAAANHAAEQVEIMETAAQDYADAVQGIMEDYYDTYNSIYEGLHNVGSAFTKVTEATKISWEDAMSNMKKNAELLDGMDANFEYISTAANAAGIEISGFSEMLASMSTEDAAGLLASLRSELEDSEGDFNHSAKTLSELGAAVSHYATAGQDYSQSLALIVEDVDQRINDATDNYKEAVEGLDQEAEAIAAGENTMNGLVSGITNGMPSVLQTVDSLASQMKSKLETSFKNFVLTIKANVSTSSDGSHKNGLDYVPFDGYIAELHKGERVLTAEEASAYRAGKDSADGGSGGVTINQYIQTPVETPAELAAATEAYFQQARWAVAL